jgi:hypothetical protein
MTLLPISPLESLLSTFSKLLWLLMPGRRRRRAQKILPYFARTHQSLQIAESPILSSQVVSSLENVTHFLTHDFPTSSGKFFPSICYPVRNDPDGEESCFTSTYSDVPKSETLMLSFAAGTRKDFIGALSRHNTFISEDFGPIKYVVENPEQESIAEMKSGKWVVYAARTLIVRFWDLAKVRMAQASL